MKRRFLLGTIILTVLIMTIAACAAVTSTQIVQPLIVTVTNNTEHDQLIPTTITDTVVSTTTIQSLPILLTTQVTTTLPATTITAPAITVTDTENIPTPPITVTVTHYIANFAPKGP